MQPIANISALAGNLLLEFLATQNVELEVTQPSDVQHWHPPDQNSHKLNFEAVVFKASNIAGIRVIIVHTIFCTGLITLVLDPNDKLDMSTKGN